MKKKGLLYFSIVLWMMQVSILTLQAQAVKTSVNTNNILIGEQIQYEITIQLASAAYKVDIGIPDSVPLLAPPTHSIHQLRFWRLEIPCFSHHRICS